MRVILKTDVDGVGQRGDIVNVSDGYGRNFLIPRGEALMANAGAVRQAATMQKSRAVQDAKELESAQEMAARFAASPIRIAARAGEGGKLFGSVSSNDIALAAMIQAQARIDKKHVMLETPIKEIGTHTVTAQPHPSVSFPITVEVVADEG